MLFKYTALLLGATFALASPVNNSSFCGSYTSPEAVANAQTLIDTSKVLPMEASQEAAFVVPVFWHVISQNNSPQGGNIPDQQIIQTMNVINQFFNGIGLYFRVAGVNRVNNPNWYNYAAYGSQQEFDMKRARQGNVQALNIYTVGNIDGNFLGYATFPWDFQRSPQRDGIIILHQTLTGGSFNGANTGKILVHEVGHWVGLLHTFEGGCNGGDFVDDTPAEAFEANGCPIGRDTCPGGGPDPVRNIMDYSNDACRIEFTRGQYNRLAQMIRQFRGISL